MSTQQITFYDHILPMFNQYDRVMMLLRFDMYDYETVKKWADKIYLSLQPSGEPGGWSKLEGTHVMPKIPGPWPQDMVDQFKAWMDQGCLEGTPPYEVPTTPTGEEFDLFVSLSQTLTGFDQCGVSDDSQILARMYYHRLINESSNGSQMSDLLNTWKSVQEGSDDEIQSKIVNSFTLSQDLITIWYNATVNGQYDPHAAPFQYQMALVWQASKAHPQGWAPENAPFYWRLPSDGQSYTGLGNFSH